MEERAEAVTRRSGRPRSERCGYAFEPEARPIENLQQSGEVART